MVGSTDPKAPESGEQGGAADPLGKLAESAQDAAKAVRSGRKPLLAAIPAGASIYQLREQVREESSGRNWGKAQSSAGLRLKPGAASFQMVGYISCRNGQLQPDAVCRY